MRISDWSSDVCSSDLAGAELTRPCVSNTGAYSMRLPAMLAVLYGALSHSARASMRYLPASPFHPAATTQSVGWVERSETHRSPSPAPQSPPCASSASSDERSVGKECVSTCKTRG